MNAMQESLAKAQVRFSWLKTALHEDLVKNMDLEIAERLEPEALRREIAGRAGEL